ncbi:MAG: alpha/beta hydrolase [Deltaproteobacteria bacterium]|nr:alpha/beta hydrolase [Deltaproteobacteria bacterium]
MTRVQSPIVLIHGLFGHLKDPRILKAFGASPVFAPDLLGYGMQTQANIGELTLQQQADHVAGFIREHHLGKVHLVGHSVGGAIAVLLSDSHPHLVASLTSVEGNFTLNDAFWSRQIAEKNQSDVDSVIAGYMAYPEAWLAGAGVPLTEWTLSLARSWLNNQPASTIKMQARAVVAATQTPDYLETVRRLLKSGLPFHLISGERSRKEWDVPPWVVAQASSHCEIPATGHLMMAENPAAFGAAVMKNLPQVQ